MQQRSRIRLLALIPLVVVVGLIARRLPSFAGDVAGGLLYAVLLYLVLAFLAPRASSLKLAFQAGLIGIAIELLQLTGLPAWLGEIWAPSRYLLGTTFVPLDLAVALIGAGLATMTDRFTIPKRDPLY